MHSIGVGTMCCLSAGRELTGVYSCLLPSGPACGGWGQGTFAKKHSRSCRAVQGAPCEGHRSATHSELRDISGVRHAELMEFVAVMREGGGDTGDMAEQGLV